MRVGFLRDARPFVEPLIDDISEYEDRRLEGLCAHAIGSIGDVVPPRRMVRCPLDERRAVVRTWKKLGERRTPARVPRGSQFENYGALDNLVEIGRRH